MRLLRLLGALCAAAVPADARLQAAAGKVDVTPDPSLSTVWLAGYGASGRKATGVQDRLHARALLLSDGRRRVAIVAVDSIGLPREDVVAWRKELGWADGKDYLFVAATHSHSTPDTMGLWGRFPGVSGVDAGYRRRLKNQVVALINDLAARLRDAEVVAAAKDVDPRGLCVDDRDPMAFDPELHAVQVRDRKDRKAIGTLVRWSCHPVTLTEANTKISADFPGPLCDRIEAGKGGTCVYVSGSIGGHLIPETDRKAPVETQYADADRIGRRIAEQALAALKRPSHVGSGLGFSSAVVRVPVENSRYLLFLPSLTAGHAIYDAEGRRLSGWREWWLPLRHLVRFPLPERLRPWVETEVGVVRIGSVKVLAVPAEIFPELVVGGYDGSRRYGRPVVGETNPNPPPLAKAPKPPYLRQRLGTRHGIVVSLANDEIGYLVPEYDFQATASRSMLPQPQGTHYEETNSIGPRATRILLEAYEALLK
ncbi:MAG: hypothetical protein HY553_14200 [Elusimicrobia bacterium]|nr:hypothetical protein [Elusimicrobiota bacterium]